MEFQLLIIDILIHMIRNDRNMNEPLRLEYLERLAAFEAKYKAIAAYYAENEHKFLYHEELS